MNEMKHEMAEKTVWRDGEGRLCSRLFAVFALLAALIALFAIPLKVETFGFVPPDDAVRHSAFATVEKTWNEILVSDRQIPDMHVGWHATLRAVRGLTGAGAEGLAVFSVVSLFLLWAVPPLFMVRRHESWMIALLLGYGLAGLCIRALLGRPFIFHTAVLTWLLLTGDRLNEKRNPWGLMVFLTLALALSIWWRTTWFMYALPVLAFVLARRWRATGRLLAMLVVAFFVALPFVGVGLAWDSLALSAGLMGSADHASQLVTELRPLTAYGTIILIFGLFAVWLRFRNRPLRAFFDTPAFFLLLISVFLGTSAAKWWLDFGVPAFVALIALEFDAFFSESSVAERLLPEFSLRRMLFSGGIALLLFLLCGVDEGGRWTGSLHNEYVDMTDDSIREGLPGTNGIVYANSPGVFFQTFFSHPEAPWRYMVGFESALMPPEDLKVYRRIQWNGGALQCFKPWVEKMRPQDRLWIMQGRGRPAPKIQGLSWTHMTSYVWSGRKTNRCERADAPPKPSAEAISPDGAGCGK